MKKKEKFLPEYIDHYSFTSGIVLGFLGGLCVFGIIESILDYYLKAN